MPAQLVWLSSALESPEVADDDRKSVHDRLLELIATCEFVESYYLADVAQVMLLSAQGSAEIKGAAVGFTLPGLTFGDSPSPAEAGALYSQFAASGAAVRPSADEEGSAAFDALSFVVYAARCLTVHARFKLDVQAPNVMEFGATESERAAEKTLERIVTAFAAQCQFKQTGDGYLHGILQVRLPAWPFSGQVSGASPFKTASRLLGEGANDAVRPLIEAGVDPFLRRLSEPDELVTHLSVAETFVVVASLVDEMCGQRRLLVNDKMAWAPVDVGHPTLFVTGDFGGLQPYSYGMIDGAEIWVSERPMQAVASMLSRSSPGTLQARLWEVASAPADADLPGNPFAKYM